MTLFDDDAGAVGGGSSDPVPEPESLRVRMTVAYDGTGRHGFWPNPGVETIGGVLEEAVGRVLDRPATLTCAGRTDAGVHARGQVVSFDAPAEGFDPHRLEASLNRMCGPTIAVRDTTVVADAFDARFSATARVYRYFVLNRPVPDPFLATTAWHVADPLDLRAMRAAADPLIGEHDFSSFCRRPDPDASLVRRVVDAGWAPPDDGLLRFDIEATAFCHQMVRSIVGTLMEVGRGRRRAGDVSAILRARDRAAAGRPAPPHGLFLWEVRYG